MEREWYALTFLRGLLWICMIWSGVATPAMIYAQQYEGMRAAQSDPGPETSKDLILKMAWRANPHGGAPTILVLPTGFLAVAYAIRPHAPPGSSVLRSPSPSSTALVEPQLSSRVPEAHRQAAERQSEFGTDPAKWTRG
jgi:hypothetical protein